MGDLFCLVAEISFAIYYVDRSVSNHRLQHRFYLFKYGLFMDIVLFLLHSIKNDSSLIFECIRL